MDTTNRTEGALVASPCQICSKPNARKSYSCVVCNACRMFFFRYCSTKTPFPCGYSNNCDITYKKGRINCAACRLKKCFNANMFREEGTHEVVARFKQSQASYVPMRRLTEIYGEMINNGFKMIISLKNCANVTAWVERRLLLREGESPSTAVANTDISLNDLLMFPGACIDRSTRASDVFSRSRSVPYKIRESILRWFVAAVENLALIEEYHLLPSIDKIKLVQENGLMICTYITHYTRYAQQWNPNTSAQFLNKLKQTASTSFWGGLLSVWASPSCIQLDTRIREIQPTEKEFMLLRIRSFFRPCVGHTEEGYAVIIQTRLKLAVRVGEYIREMNPHFTEEQVKSRLCQLLELETLLKEIQIILNNTMLTLTVLGSEGCGTPLLQELFIQNS